MIEIKDILDIVEDEKSITFVIDKKSINDIEFIKIIIDKLSIKSNVIFECENDEFREICYNNFRLIPNENVYDYGLKSVNIYIRELKNTSNTVIFGSNFKSNIIFLFTKKLKIIRLSDFMNKVEFILDLNSFIRKYKLETIQKKVIF